MDVLVILVTFLFGLAVFTIFALAIALVPFERPSH